MAGARPDPEVAGIQSTEAPVTQEPPRGAAFFDVDNTMMVGASIFHFAKGLAARKFFDWHDVVRFTVRQAKLRTRGESKGDMHATRDSALAFVAGKKVTDVVALGEEIYDETMADRIWPGTHALARGHLAAGRQVWLVTATPAGARPDHRRSAGPDRGPRHRRRDQRRRVHRRCWSATCCTARPRRTRLRSSPPERVWICTQCSAYSDSINDLPLLSLVGTAVAVNPDSALRGEARRSRVGDPRLPHRPQGDPGRRARRDRRISRRRWDHRGRDDPPPPASAAARRAPALGRQREAPRQRQTDRRCMSSR